LSWTVLLHHNTHTHILVSSTGSGGSFLVEDHGVGDFGFEIILNATDSSGLKDTKSIFLPMPSVGPAGLAATYGLNEASGTTTADGSGNGNPGTLTNGPVRTTGKYGNGLSFDGVNDFVSAADSASLDLAGTGTIEAWVKLDTLNRWHSVIAKGDQNSNARHNYALEITNANRIRCILSTGTGSNYIQLDSASTMTANVFGHLACTWDGTTVSLYIDGVLNASRAQTLTPVPNTSPLFIGVFGGNNDRLDGTIDEVRIYNRALTPAEIQTDKNTPIP
jgi:concanavalin A-like lectin/glucanase superfamily protein